MPPSDPACPTCGTQVRANDYWSYLAGPSSPRVYYPKSIMDDNPEIAGTFTRCADPFHAAPSDPAAVPPPDDQAMLDALFADAPDARDSAAWRDEPPLPQWAVEKADEWLRRSDEDPLLTLARLLASVRESTIREAAVEGATAATDGRSVSVAIHALLHTPPSGGAG